MATDRKWYPSDLSQNIIPWNAQYSFPTQANKALKTTSRITPKGSGPYRPGNVIRWEYAAQGYVNPHNTVFQFDVTLLRPGKGGFSRFQNGIKSIFDRVRLVYGSTPLEDISGFNVITRGLTEWTSTNNNGVIDQESIDQGLGGYTYGYANTSSSAEITAKTPNLVAANVNVRQAYIQGIDRGSIESQHEGFGFVPNSAVGESQFKKPDKADTEVNFCCTRRYTVQLDIGLMIQDKLLPTKWMASQLAVEATLARPESCILQVGGEDELSTYVVSNVHLISEVLDFDDMYDASFMDGLQQGGVPMKYSTWHQYTFNINGQSNVSLQIQERSRSVKSVIAVQRRSTDVLNTDAGTMFMDSSPDGGTMISYQFRIGSRFFPAAPVEMTFGLGSNICNGGAEAWTELKKALNSLGDYRSATSNSALRWALPYEKRTEGTGDNEKTLPDPREMDYEYTPVCFDPEGRIKYLPNAKTEKNCGTMGSSCFAIATSLETTNGVEVSGLNAQEQSDIVLNVRWTKAQAPNMNMEVYVLFDSMLILRPNNEMGILILTRTNSIISSVLTHCIVKNKVCLLLYERR